MIYSDHKLVCLVQTKGLDIPRTLLIASVTIMDELNSYQLLAFSISGEKSSVFSWNEKNSLIRGGIYQIKLTYTQRLYEQMKN